MMRMRKLAVAVLACGLFGGIVALAQQRPADPRVIDAASPPPEAPAPLLPAPDPAPDLPPTAIAPGNLEGQDDPVQALEAFVLRSRREAEEAIDKLTKETETLRARLQKVETALDRWKGVRDALNQEASAGVKAGQVLEPIPSSSGPGPRSGRW